MEHEAIVIGVSAGGLHALSEILSALPPDFPIPVIIVQHRSRDEKTLLEEVLQSKCIIKIKQADEKEKIRGCVVYVAPPDYHLLIEKDGTFSLNYDAKLNFSRPSIDVLFETASEVYENKVVGIILTGASNDGAAGITAIKKRGGITIAQDPKNAEFPVMPQAAIDTGSVQYIFKLEEIKDYLLSIRKQ